MLTFIACIGYAAINMNSTKTVLNIFARKGIVILTGKYMLLSLALFLILFFMFRSYAIEEYYTNKAYNFLIENYNSHSVIHRQIVDGRGKTISYSPYLYNNLYTALKKRDSLLQSCVLWEHKESDSTSIEKSFLKQHARKMTRVWLDAKWHSKVNFEDFCEYILPYRVSDEKFQEYISIVNTHSVDARSIGLDSTVKYLNHQLKKKLKFDLRSHAQPDNPSVIETCHNGRGSCSDVTQISAQVMRMYDICVTIDACPVWAHRNSGHQWNVYLTENKKWIPFGVSEENRFDAINADTKPPKVYRRVFSVNPIFCPPVENRQNIPSFFGDTHQLDVTEMYTEVADVKVRLPESISKENGIIYSAVFNAEQWRIVTWAKNKNGSVIFRKMGSNNIIYLPVLFKSGNIIPIANPILVNSKHSRIIQPGNHNRNVQLKYYNKFYDTAWQIGYRANNLKTKLYYWKDDWVLCDSCHQSNKVLLYRNVPDSALYLSKFENDNNTWQQIFTINNGEQVWY